MAFARGANTEATEHHDRPPVMQWLWVLAAALLGFAVTAIFAGMLALPRDAFVAVYVAIVASFLWAYIRWTGLDIHSFLLRRWAWGIVGVLAVGGLMVASVQRMAASPRADGAALALDIVWLGIVYGIVDALLLNVLPVVAVWRAFANSRWSAHWVGKVLVGMAALAASLGVTAAYHLGYPEFRGSDVVDPLIGNGAMTLGYLLTGSPIAAIGAHVALHVASVLHGVETTVTLPPHY